MLKNIAYMPRRAFIGLIRIYQKTISPDTGVISHLFPYGFCKYHPTCSEYTCQAVQQYGVLRGTLKGAWRVVRCNPYSKGGFDYVK